MISIGRGVGDDHVSISLMDVKSIHRRVQENSDVGPRLKSSASVTLARKQGIRTTRDDKAMQFMHHPAGSGPGMHLILFFWHRMHAPVVRVIHVSFRNCSDLNFPLRFRSFFISCRLKLVGLTLPSPDDPDELELVLCVGLTLE